MDKGNIKILFIGLLFLISLSVIVFSDTTLNTYIPGTSWNQNVTGQWLNRTGILGNIMGSNILANVTKGGVCGNYTFFINVSQGSATTHINLSSINISLPTGWTYNGNNYTVNYTQSPSALTTVPVDLTNFNCTGVNATGVVSGININQPLDPSISIIINEQCNPDAKVYLQFLYLKKVFIRTIMYNDDPNIDYVVVMPKRYYDPVYCNKGYVKNYI